MPPSGNPPPTAATPAEDDEFSYALDGQERAAGFHHREFTAAAPPAHLVTNVAALPDDTIAEGDEDASDAASVPDEPAAAADEAAADAAPAPDAPEAAAAAASPPGEVAAGSGVTDSERAALPQVFKVRPRPRSPVL